MPSEAELQAELERLRAENEALKKRLTIGDQIALYNGNQLERFFAVKVADRRRQMQMARRQSWRSGGR